MDDSGITCGQIIVRYNEGTKTVLTNFSEEKLPASIFHLSFC